MAMEDFDNHKFTIVSTPFAAAIMVVFIAWFLINQFKFKWRPAYIGRSVISHSINRPLDSCATTFLLILYWIFFLLPFLLFIGWGVTVALLFKPYLLGVILGVGPTMILLIIYLYLDFHYRGYVPVVLTKVGITFAFIVILAVTFASVYMLDRQKWIEISYLYSFLPSIFFMFSYTYSHRYIPNDVLEYALKSKEHLEEFEDDISNRDECTCFKGSKRLNVWWSIGNVLFSLVVNFLYALNYYFKDKNNEKGERDATFFTAVGFFMIDFLLLLAQVGTPIRPSFFIIILLDYLVKICAITFSTNYWIAGHGVNILFLSSFLMIRFILGFWKPAKSSQLHPVDAQGEDSESAGNELNNLDEENVNKLVVLLTKIMNKTVQTPKVSIVMSIISWLILIAAFLAEVIMQYKKEFVILPFDVKQIDVLIACGVLSVPFALMVCAVLYLYFNSGNMSAGTYVMYILSIAILVVFDALWQGVKNLLLLRLLFPTIFIFVFSFMMFLLIAYYQPRASFKKCKVLFPCILYFIITAISLALSIALPLALQKYFKQDYDTVTKLSGLMIVLIVFAIQLYSFFLISYLRENSMNNAKTIIAFILSILFVAGFCCCTLNILTALVIFFSVMVVFCMVFSFFYTMHDDWTFSVKPYLVLAIPSFIILGLSIAAMFLIKNNRYLFYLSILAFIFAFMFFGSSLFFWLQRKNFYFNWASIICVIFLVISAAAVIGFISLKYKQAFVVISIILLCIFITSLLGMLCFVISQSISNVIVVSNVFFPIRRLVDDKIRTITMFNLLYTLTFICSWFWGLFGSVFFDNHPDYGSLASTGAIFLIVFITCYFISQFDFNTYSSLEFIQKDAIKYAINTAMEASSISIELVSPDRPDDEDYELFMEYFNQIVEANRNISLFLSAVKAELFISSDVAFRSAKNQVHNFFHQLGYSDDDLEFLTYETGWTTTERLQIYELLEKIREYNPKLVEEEEKFNDKVKKQTENRLQVKVNKNNLDNTEYQKLLSKLKNKNSLYEDPDFNQNTERTFSKAYWRRLEGSYKNPMFDSKRGFSFNIIKQGQIGDCYLISAMVAISRNPRLIEKIFSDPINNQNGIRCVNFHIMGQIVPVIVDTTVPFRGESESSLPMSCAPVNFEDQWYAPIIEKAYAKHYGSYRAIEGGNSHIAMYRLIGGFPICYIMSEMKTKEMIQNGTLWKLMLKWHQDGNFMCTGSKPGSDTTKSLQGIVYGHAYTILQVVECYGNKLLQLRNPWGNGEWKGDWSDKSSKWTQKMKNAVDYRDDENDGAFWMCFNDYINNYNSIYACIKIKDNFHYELNGVMSPGGKDGASPFSNPVADADVLPQWIIRSKSSSPPNLSFILEKTGGLSYIRCVLVYGSGEKLKYLTSGSKFDQFHMPNSTPLSSFQWTYDEPSRPVNVVIARDKLKDSTNWHLDIYSDRELEITHLE